MGKFLFYLSVLPEDISLLRHSYSQYPDDDECLYVSQLNLNK